MGHERRRRVRGDGRRSVRYEEIPSAAREQDEKCRGQGGERSYGETLFRQRGRNRLRRLRGLGLRRNADLQRIDPDRLGDVLELGRAEIGDSEFGRPLTWR